MDPLTLHLRASAGGHSSAAPCNCRLQGCRHSGVPGPGGQERWCAAKAIGRRCRPGRERQQGLHRIQESLVCSLMQGGLAVVVPCKQGGRQNNSAGGWALRVPAAVSAGNTPREQARWWLSPSTPSQQLLETACCSLCSQMLAANSLAQTSAPAAAKVWMAATLSCAAA